MGSESSPLKYAWITSGGRSGKAFCELGWDWTPSEFHDYDLWYAVSGTGKIIINNRSYAIHKGACFILCPGDRVIATQDSKDRLVMMYAHFSVFDLNSQERLDPNVLPPCYTVVDDTHMFENHLHNMLEIERSDELWKEEEFNGVMKHLLLQLYRIHFRANEEQVIPLKHKHIIRKVLAYIRMNGVSYSVSPNELSQLVNLSPQYLSRMFKRYMGYSLKEYSAQVKMERAVELLSETSMSITQISEVLGYADIYSFSTQFKHFFGQSPTLFRCKSHPARSHYGKKSRKRTEVRQAKR